MQLHARVDVLGEEKMAQLLNLDLGDLIGADGTVFRTRRGELSLKLEDFALLAKSLRPPPDKHHGLADVETRHRHREVDLLSSEETRATFITRAKVIAAIRRFLDDAGFVEVETPVLQPIYGGAAARPFVTHHNQLDRDLFLRIATELYLKRLIVGGLERVYELGKDFRNESVSYKHQPEFTMLEWYEAYADFQDTMDRIETMLERVALEALGTTVVRFRGSEVDLKRPWKRVGFVESLEAHELWTRDESELRAWLTERGASPALTALAAPHELRMCLSLGEWQRAEQAVERAATRLGAAASYRSRNIWSAARSVLSAGAGSTRAVRSTIICISNELKFVEVVNNPVGLGLGDLGIPFPDHQCRLHAGFSSRVQFGDHI